MEEERRETTAPECRKNNDLRTFVIALLTSVIVLALYHFGSGLCKIYCSDCSSAYYPTQRYMLVPVMEVPMPGMDEGAMDHPGRGRFGMRRPGGFREGGMGPRPDWKRGPGFKGKRPDGQFGPRGEYRGPKGFRGPHGPKGKPAQAGAPEAKGAPAAEPPAKPAAKPAADAKPAPAPAK